jgi:integrase
VTTAETVRPGLPTQFENRGAAAPAVAGPRVEGQLVEPRGAWLPQEARELFTERSRLLKTDRYLLEAPLNTQRARRADWALFCAFCEAQGVTAMPANPDTVVSFLEAVHSTAPRSGGRPRREIVRPASLARRARRARAAEEGAGIAGHRGRARGPQRAAKTLERYRSTVAAAHRLADQADPTRTARVRNALHALMRTLRASRPRAPLRREPLLALMAALWPANLVPSGAANVATASPPSAPLPEHSHRRARSGWHGASLHAAQLWDLRARALLATLYSTMARRQEVIELRYEDLPRGTRDGVVPIHATKTGRRDHRFVDELALACVLEWCEAARIRGGAVFRGLDWRGRLVEGAISPQQVLRIVRAVVAHGLTRRAAVDSDPPTPAIAPIWPEDVGAHSSRIGAAHDLVAAGQDLLAIMQSGGWQDARMPRQYVQELRAQDSGMARMLRNIGPAPDSDQALRRRTRAGSGKIAVVRKKRRPPATPVRNARSGKLPRDGVVRTSSRQASKRRIRRA